MKKVLILLMFLIGASAVAHAETETTLYPYMNTPETVYFDDNFNDRDPGVKVTGNTDEYAVDSFGSAVTEQEGDNIFCRTPVQWLRLRANKNSPADCDRLTVAFDIKFGVNSTYGNIYIGGEAGTNTVFKFNGGPSQMSVSYMNKTGSTQNIVTESAAADGWNHLAVTIRREANEDGSYSVYPEKVALNGTIKLIEDVEPANEAVNWWDNMYVNIGNYNQADVCMDNVIIYSPKEFGAETVAYDEEAGTVNAEFTAGISKENTEIVLVSADGEKACAVETDESMRKAVITVPEQLDLENKAYYIVVKAIYSVCGEKFSGYKLPLCKKLAAPLDETQMSAVKKGDSVYVTAVAEPYEGKTVYLIVGVWSDKKLLNLKVIPCSEPNFCEVEAVGCESADRVQIFLLDNTENAELVSKVYDLKVE